MSSTEPQSENAIQDNIDDLNHMVCTACYPNPRVKIYALCGNEAKGPMFTEGELTCVVCAEQFCRWHGPLMRGR